MAAGNFFGGEFFGGGFFGANAPSDVLPAGGKGDNDRRLHLPVKPTGLLHRPRKEGRKDVQSRIEDSGAIQAEVAAKLAREFSDETIEQQAEVELARLSAAEIDFEIGVLLHKKLRTQEDELILLMLMAASVA